MTTTIIRPSQWVNVLWIFIGIFSFVMAIVHYIPGLDINYTLTSPLWVIPLVISLWKILLLYCWSYEIQEKDGHTITEQRGVLTSVRVEVKYFRIKSIRVVKPLFLRMLGLSNIQIITSEPFKPVLLLYAVPNGENIVTFLQEMATNRRAEMGVKETDFHSF